jgi:hypothetical protein
MLIVCYNFICCQKSCTFVVGNQEGGVPTVAPTRSTAKKNVATFTSHYIPTTFTNINNYAIFL